MSRISEAFPQIKEDLARLPRSLESFCKEVKTKIAANQAFVLTWPNDSKLSPEIGVKYEVDTRLIISIIASSTKLIDNKYKELVVEVKKSNGVWKQRLIGSDRLLTNEERGVLGLVPVTEVSNEPLRSGIKVAQGKDLRKSIADFAIEVITTLARKKICPTLYDLTYQTVEYARNRDLVKRLCGPKAAVPEPDEESYVSFLLSQAATKFIHDFASWMDVLKTILKNVKLEKRQDGPRNLRKEERIAAAALTKLHQDKLKYTPRQNR